MEKNKQQTVYLVFQQGTSNKFYRVEFGSSTATITWGRIGSKGQSQIISRDEAEKRLQQKMAAGYMLPTEPPQLAPKPSKEPEDYDIVMTLNNI